MSGFLGLLLANAPPSLAVEITNQSVIRTVVGGTATPGYRLDNTGSALKTNATGAYTAIAGEWLVTGTVANFETRGTWSGAGTGTISGPTTWVSLSSTQTWTYSETGTDSSKTLTVEIRDAATTTVLDTATITLTANGSP
jgi:hypothetical protein